MNTLLNRTHIFASTAALTILGSQAGHCDTVKASPKPPLQDIHFVHLYDHLLTILHHLQW